MKPAFIAICFAAGALAQNTPQLKATPGFSLGNLDRSVSPCDDFYQYACGTWLKDNPIPPDQTTWGRFSVLAENNRTILRGILEKAMVAANQKDADTQKIGDYYAACMDVAAIEKKGLQPLDAEISHIRAMKTLKDLTAEIARLHRDGVSVLFGFGGAQDFKNSNSMIGFLSGGGLGLPERDYYFRTDPKSVETRREYVAHVGRTLRLVGYSDTDAASQADLIMKLETALAKVTLDVTTRRDPAKVYHPMKPAEFEALVPSLDWTAYFAARQAPPMQTVNVREPDFFKGEEELLKSTLVSDWQSYMIFHLVSSQSSVLPRSFRDESFAFNEKFLSGAKEQQPRWRQCVRATDDDLGEALGKAYVDLTFGKEGKDRTLEMVKRIEAAMAKDLDQIAWMTPATKQKALEKLHAVSNKIGYPEKWRDYSALRVDKGDALGNSVRANEFEINRRLQKIGKPVDRTEWEMTPPTVNAYYSPLDNNINFPAGILQPPFFDRSMSDAINYGAVGAVIGHELTHGFDDKGSQFDPKGNFENWWSEADRKAFDEREECLVREYSSFETSSGVQLNGKLTLGENTADNGGLRLAYMALMDDLAGRTLPRMQDFDEKQQFFLGFAQVWCTNQRPESERLQAQTNPHSTARYRVNGVVSNMPEFQAAFGCKEGLPMVRDGKACRTW